MDTSTPEEQSTPAENKRILEIKEQINDLKKRWPAHSVPPSMLQRLDELEEELETELHSQSGRR